MLKYKLITIRILTITLTFITVLTSSGYATFTSRYSNWLSFDVGSPFHEGGKWHYNVMSQARIPTGPVHLEQYFVRPSVYYQLNKNWSVWLGYDFIVNNPQNNASAIEQRIWPQIQYSKQLTKHFAVALRSRLENRWLSTRAGTALRFRQRVEFSIDHWNKYNINFDAFDEVFLGVQKPSWVNDRTLDQNRVFLGFVIPLNKRFDIDTGYLNIFRPRSPNNQTEHILVLSLALNLDGEPVIPIQSI